MSIGMAHTEAVGKLLKTLDEHRSLEHLRKIHEENIGLQNENKTLKIVNEENDRKLARYLKNADSSKEEAKKAAERLEAELKNKKDLENKSAAALGKLKVAERDLAAKSSELKRLEGFAAEMKPISSETRRGLEALCSSARGLAQAYFGTDFSEEVIGDDYAWSKIDGHCCVKKQIPLLDSNTVASKQMRVAAVLAILSWELAFFCFRPTYILDEENDLFELMSNMVKHDPEREVYLRSVLLEVLNETGQNKATQHRIDMATKHIFSLISPPFEKGDRESLYAAIENLCKEACDRWGHIQRLRSKIEPVFDPDVKLRSSGSKLEDWAPLTIKLPESPSSANPTSSGQKSQQNGLPSGSGSGGNPGRGRKQGGQQQSQQQQSQQQPQADPTTDVSSIAVWPVFVVVSGDSADLGVFAPGYVLRDSYLQTALDELRAQQSMGRRRDRRDSLRRTRTKSVSAGVEVAGASAGDINPMPTTSEPFLSSRVGGGQKAG